MSEKKEARKNFVRGFEDKQNDNTEGAVFVFNGEKVFLGVLAFPSPAGTIVVDRGMKTDWLDRCKNLRLEEIVEGKQCGTTIVAEVGHQRPYFFEIEFWGSVEEISTRQTPSTHEQLTPANYLLDIITKIPPYDVNVFSSLQHHKLKYRAVGGVEKDTCHGCHKCY
ncbi:hypothetical protein L2E82_30561 [Cichorium intybus]|uniref:Uncharacterized protein n=1 Tax=Cichorium intybus TaxID=13427 RepID=A0ACB9D0X6_CICIN|nr:hypothetical protein L2E82_30561 [Cichorium intybus]